MTDPTTRDPAAILPCPFCGKSVACVADTNELGRNSILMHTVICNAHKGGCGSCVGFENSEEEAVEAWNRRDAAPALLAEVERLRAEVLRWQSVNAANITLHRDRAEAAEQVAREAHELLRAVVAGLSAVPNAGPKTRAVLELATTHLAHHGARTGESK